MAFEDVKLRYRSLGPRRTPWGSNYNFYRVYLDRGGNKIAFNVFSFQFNPGTGRASVKDAITNAFCVKSHSSPIEWCRINGYNWTINRDMCVHSHVWCKKVQDIVRTMFTEAEIRFCTGR